MTATDSSTAGEAAPVAMSEEEQRDKAAGTANMLGFAAEAAAAAGEDESQVPGASRRAGETPSIAVHADEGSSLKPSMVHSADSFYGYNTGLSEGETAEGQSTDYKIDPAHAQPTGSDDQAPPPAYSDTLGAISGETEAADTNASVGDDGRVNIRINQRSHKLSHLLVPALRQQRQFIAEQEPPPPPYIPPNLGGSPGELPPPPMNVVIHVVGSRGDVQPFVALGIVLRDTYGHRVRLATHPVFKDFVEENGLEFFSIGGDPSELMAFMVKNPGLLPGFDTLRNGDVGKRRAGIAEMIRGCWRSCIESGDGTGIEASDSAIGDWMTNPDSNNAPDKAFRPFVADAIIANPPSFAHIHCAEWLGIPLHMMFTMPWSPTEAFPHPLANIESTNAEQTISNYITYGLIDLLTWQGLGDIINKFRIHNLGLEPVSFVWAPGMLARLKIPYTYCWSPALIPKPNDWGSHISISGFYFLNLATNFTPAPELDAFLKAGPPPVYIGFGSIVVDDPNAMTKMIFEAVKKTGQRALVSKGWGGLGGDELGVPEGVFMLGNVPHDWLFQHVSCVVHHGGAGTTAAGIACGKPTVIVPFFGDQPFWGSMVNRAGAGPKPVRYKDLTADILAESIEEALKPSSLERAGDMAKSISKENGCDTGAQAFHQMIDLDKMRCSILPEQVAVWRIKRTEIRLSALAAYVLATKEIISFSDLKLYRQKEYEVDSGPPDPISGASGAVVDVLGSMMMGVADFPVAALKALAIHPDAHRSKEEKQAAKDDKQHAKDERHQASNDRKEEKRQLKDEKKNKSRSASGVSGTSTPASSTAPSSVLSPTTTSAGASRTSLSTERTLTPPSSPGESTPGVSKNTTMDWATASPEYLSRESTNASDTSSLLSPGSGAPGPLQHRGSAMSEAFRNLPDSARPRSRSNSRTRHGSHQRSNSDSKGKHYAECDPGAGMLDTAYGTGKGVSKIVGAGLKSPMDVLLGLSKGFGNMPKLYGEEVRQPDRVTGIKSGFRTAGKEFGLGMFDGVTGLFTQPVQGAKEGGAAGFIKGFGKGLAGIVVKPAAGIYGLPGYAMKGVYKEIQKHFGASVQNYIIAARTAQGWEMWLQCDKDEQTDIVHRYLKLVDEVKRKKGMGEHQAEIVQDFINQRKEKRRDNWSKINQRRETLGSGFLDKKKTWQDSLHRASTTGSWMNHSSGKSISKKPGTHEDIAELPGSEIGRSSTGPSTGPRPSASHNHSTGEFKHSSRMPIQMSDNSESHEDFERALQQSIQDTSQGDAHEDQAIAEGVRASIAHLQQQASSATVAGDGDDDDDQLRLAIQESLKHTSGQQESGVLRSTAGDITPTPQHAALDQAAADVGVQEPGGSSLGRDAHAAHDEEMKKAIEESRMLDAEQEKARREEEIVLEYIKKQSLIEEEHRKRVAEGRETAGEASGSGEATK